MKSFPLEIIHKILQETSHQELYESALVCKAWLTPTQSVLYSNVSIRTESQLEGFHNTISHSPQLAKKVKTLYVDIEKEWLYENREEVDIEVTDLLSKLLPLLPNLEKFSDIQPFNYTPLVNALSTFYLKRLRTLQVPIKKRRGNDRQTYLDYSNCALLMKDRLENISLTNITYNEGRLGSQLDQFNNLVEISISLQTEDEINIFERCATVKKISFYFAPSPILGHISPAQPPSITDITPSTSVKSLNGTLNDDNNFKLIVYIMHKFSQLDELNLHFAISNPVKFDLTVVAKLLNYISAMDTFTIRGLLINQNGITKTIGNFWEATSSGSESLKICHRGDIFNSTRVTLDVAKKDHTQETTLTYNGHSFDWSSYMDFVQKSGKDIRDLHFKSMPQNAHRLSDMLSLHDDFVPHTLIQCTNLQNLRVERCNLEHFSLLGSNLTKSCSLRKLAFHFCTLYNGFLEQVSPLLSDINHLEFIAIKYLCTSNQQSLVKHNTFLNVIMPNTNIQTITIALQGFIRSETVYVQVLSINELRCNFYRFDILGFNSIKDVSNEQEYNAFNEDKHIYVCCQNNPTINIRL